MCFDGRRLGPLMIMVLRGIGIGIVLDDSAQTEA